MLDVSEIIKISVNSDTISKTAWFIKSAMNLDWLSLLIFSTIGPFLLIVAPTVKNAISGWIKNYSDGIVYNLIKFLNRKSASDLSLKRFAKQQLDNDNNNILSVPSRDSVTLKTDEAFITLSLENTSLRRRFDHITLFEAGKRVRIIGDPGSGKSSLVKRLYREACKLLQKKPGEARLPVFLELRHIKDIPENNDEDTQGKYLYEKLNKQVSGVSVYRAGELLDICSEGKGILVLLDGLDEVSSGNYERIMNGINGLCYLLDQKGPDNNVVLTMRTQFHHQIGTDFSQRLPVVLMVQPFSPEDIYTFLTRWPFPEKGSSSPNLGKRDHIRRIYDNLSRLPTLREMCRNPLVLAMYVAEDVAAQGLNIPESRTIFYKNVLTELIIKRRISQGTTYIGSHSEHDRRFELLGHIAYDHVMNQDETINTLQWNIILETTTKFLLNRGLSDEDPRRYIFEIAKDTGLISEERVEESWRFIHLTLCEYLAAHYAVNYVNNGWELLYKKYLSFRTSANLALASRLDEVIPFAAGLLQPKNVNKALDDISEVNHIDVQCRVLLETKRYDHPCWQRIKETFSEMLCAPFATHSATNWLNNLRLATTVFQDANNSLRKADHKIFDDAISASIINSNNTDAIQTFAKEDAMALYLIFDSMGIDDPLMEYADLFLSVMDQPPLQDHVIALVEQNGENRKDLCAFLVEAALRLPSLAIKLHETKIWAWLEKVTASFDKNKLKYSKIFRKSTYTSLLEIVKVDYPFCSLSKILGELERPKKSIFFLMVNLLFFALVLSCGAYYVAYYEKYFIEMYKQYYFLLIFILEIFTFVNIHNYLVERSMYRSIVLFPEIKLSPKILVESKFFFVYSVLLKPSLFNDKFVFQYFGHRFRKLIYLKDQMNEKRQALHADIGLEMS
ncbi:MAG: NACHT domain-containing protein [Magnetococcales bacterium]|nr:NACHT domain-containing protein [Magnetococcales bacterium]